MDNLLDELGAMNLELLQEAINTVLSEESLSCVSNDSDNSDILDILDISNETDAKNNNNNDIEYLQSYGCKHYLRRCKFIAPCCDKIFSCRICHDEEMNSLNIPFEKHHNVDRHNIKKIICSECNQVQNIGQYCENCNICFGLYFCKKCNLFDDIDKGQFHCDKCGICRVDGKNNYYHCDHCNTCVDISASNNHKCINIKHFNCPICMDDLFSSTFSVIRMKCGHYIHKNCLISLLKTDYKCPLCSISIVDLYEYNKILDKEIAETPMPDEYEDKKVNVLCNECHTKFETIFHIIGHKCTQCGTYNTKLI